MRRNVKMNAHTIRARLIESVIPLIPQLSGKPPHTERRNICLIAHPWFARFEAWIHDEANPHPGAIDNRPLTSELELRHEVHLGVHFDYVEKNVWDALAATFTGGPMILRPFMTDVVTNESRPVVYPVKFTITFEGRELVRTADPMWRMASFKAYIAKMLDADSAYISIKARKDGFVASDGMLTADVRLNHGSVLDVSRVEVEAPRTARDVSDWRDSVSSGESGRAQSVRGHSHGGASLIMSIFEIITRLDAVTEACHGHAKDNNIGKLVERMMSEVVQHEMVESVFAARGLVFSKMQRRYDAGPLLDTALDVIGSGLVDPRSIRSLFEVKMVMSAKCSSCGFSAKGEVLDVVLNLEIPQKWLKKVTINDCINNFLTSKQKIEDWECPKCGHNEAGASYKLSTLPPVLVCCVNRFSIKSEQVLKNQAEVYYGPDLKVAKSDDEKGKYKLKGVIGNQKQAFKLNFKTFYYSQKHQTWVTVSDGNARSIQVSTVVVPAAVFMLFYIRENA